ncbi:MAG: T9SS type A sorting domain-containing protein [Bacteroidia bacterium]|nr:T9SS type A sorting domain-containing protein [Bacteroidia bacterium]
MDSAQVNIVGDGLSWSTAYVDLESALDSAKPGDSIFVASGVYRNPTNSRDEYYELKDSLVIMGGFVGLGHPPLDSLQLDTIETVLSADIGVENDPFDNTYQLFRATAITHVEFHRITFTDANADLSGTPNNFDRGGAFFLKKSSITFRNCRFVKNRSSLFGGAIFADDASSLFFESCDFAENIAAPGVNSIRNRSRGGAIYTNSSSLDLKQCRFLRNRTDELGGAITALTNSILTLDACEFIDNKVEAALNQLAIPQGGAICSFGSIYKISDCIFRNNASVGTDARAGAFRDGTSFQSFVENSTFENNSAERGGAIYYGISNPILKNSLIKDNTAALGGGIFFETSDPELDSCILLSNSSTQQGGGVYIESSSPSFSKSVFFGNTTTQNGGGIYMKAGSNPSINRTVFAENQASLSGGGVYCLNGSNPKIVKSLFIDNLARNGGGAFFEVSCDPEVNFNLFQHNIAAQNGGAIYSQSGNSNPRIMASSFINNRAEGTSSGGIGGAVYNGLQSIMLFQNSTLYRNHAKLKGGGLFSENELDIYHSTISNNTIDVSTEGQQLFLDGNTRIKNTIVAEIEADSLRDIALENGANLTSQGYNFFRDSIPQLHETDIINYNQSIFAQNMALSNNGIPIGIDLDTFDLMQPLPSLAIKADGIIVNNGEPITENTIDFDTRGYSRVIGGREFERIDIGAYEVQHLFSMNPVSEFCSSDTRFLELKDIVIWDSTGGALRIGDSMYYQIAIPQGMEIDISNGEVESSLPSFIPRNLNFENGILSFFFDKSYADSIHEIRISGLTARSTNTNRDSLLFISSTVLQDELDQTNPLSHIIIGSFPTYKINTDFPYDENFENGPSIWLSSDQREGWSLQIPNGNVIDTAYSGTNAWTLKLDSTENYFANKDVFLISECLDLSELEKPMIEAAVWTDTEEGFDGVVLEYSIDAGKNWNVLGEKETGVNWYNSNNIIAIPGDQPSGELLGWTGKSSTWISIANRMDQLPLDNLLRFRFAFSSVGLIDQSQEKNGFAIDDIFIGERSRNVLLEDFGDPNELQDMEDFLSDMDKEVFQIRYELKSSEFDASEAGPRTRALFYGIDQPGPIVYGGNGFLGSAGEMDQESFDAELLEHALFTISIDSTLFEPIQIKALKSTENEILVYAAIVELLKEKWMFRKFLPDPAGISFMGWQAEESKSLVLNWDTEDFPAPNIVNEYDSLRLLVFVQDLSSKKVFQAAMSPVWESLIKRSDVEKRGNLAEDIQGDLKMYPNPTNGRLFLEIPEDLEKPFNFKLYNSFGQVIYQDELPENSRIIQLDLSHISKGLYHAILSHKGIIQQRKKIFFIH